MITVKESEAKVCLNCTHKYGILCALTDELIEDNCSCQMFRKEKITNV